MEPSSAKKHPVNNSLFQVLCILGNPLEQLNHRMKIMAQKEARKDRRLELKAEHKNWWQLIDLQEHKLQKWAAESQHKATESWLQFQVAIFEFIQQQQKKQADS